MMVVLFNVKGKGVDDVSGLNMQVKDGYPIHCEGCESLQYVLVVAVTFNIQDGSIFLFNK